MQMSTKIHQGDIIPQLVRNINQEKINLYAEASGDFNPIHIDESFAAQTPLGGTIAHGMLILAYISEMLTGAFGQIWLSGGKLSVRFKAPARPGDTITVTGMVSSIEDKNGVSCANCVVECRNQEDEIIITGGALVKLSEGED